MGFSVPRRTTSRRVSRGELPRVSKGSRAWEGDRRERRSGEGWDRRRPPLSPLSFVFLFRFPSVGRRRP